MFILTISLDILQWLLLLFWIYWTFISLLGFGKPLKLREKPPQKRFLLLVAAHNEEKVIAHLVENLLNLDYPKNMYDVYVIADNCTDKTAQITKEIGGRVIEHTSLPDEPRGKPYGIKYAFDYFGEDLTEKYDGVAIFDADNLVSLNYLKEMNNHLLNGERLIQCYLDSKNPNDNWITLSYATSYYYMNRSWQLAKSRLGLGNAIGGTGFCVDTELIKEVGWTAKSLTEDLEFTMQCLLKGVRATWSHYARVYDEKPEGFIASCIQRLRWARGHWDVCFKYAHKLLWRAIRKRDIVSFDGFLYLINPGKIVLGAMISWIIFIELFFQNTWMHVLFPWWLWFSFLLFGFGYVIYTILIDSGQKINKAKAIISLFIFNYSYIPLFLWSLFTIKNKTWKRTDHSRDISYTDMNITISEIASTDDKNE